jgi:hypothetical protein
MIRQIRLACAALALSAAPALAEAPAPAPEPVTIDAFSIWEATGSVIAIGPTAHAFAGEMHGPYFIDAGAGPIPAGSIACVGALEADAASGRQTGAARCRLQAHDGAVAYGRFACEGWRMVGCAGVFLLDGGEGRLAGARGEGPIVLRRHETALVGSGDGRVSELALGIASWKGFTMTAAPSAP